MPTTRYTTIVFHDCPHLDEIFAHCMIKHWFPKEAERVWPGSSTAGITVLKTGSLRDQNESDFPGHLFIGCGKGPLDEHRPQPVTARECATTLVARKLGVMKLPEFRKPIADILDEDRNGSKDLHVALIVKLMYSMKNPPSVAAITEWVRQAFVCILNDQQENRPYLMGKLTIWNVVELMQRQKDPNADSWIALAELVLKERSERQREAMGVIAQASVEKLVSPTYGPIKLAVVHGGNDQIAHAAWDRQIDVLIRFQPSGNVQIMTRRKRAICLREVAALVRNEELRLRVIPELPKDDPRLRYVDTIPEVPNWHLMNSGQQNKQHLFNGTPTAPEMEPTILAREVLVGLVKNGLGCQ